MHPHRPAALALAALVALTAFSGSAAAQGGGEDNFITRFIEDMGRAIGVGGLPGPEVVDALLRALGPAGGALAQALLTVAGDLAEAIAGYAGGFVQLDPGRALLAGSGDGRQGATACRAVPALAEFSRKGAEPTFTLALGTSPGAPQCSPRAATWRASQVSGDWNQGWVAYSSASGVVQRATLGPHGTGQAIALTYEVWQGGALQYRFAGTVQDLA